MTEEKRKFLRLNILTDIVYTKVALADKQKLSLAKNISQGGICIICYERMQESDVLDLRIYLPQEKTPINALGRVVWIKEFVIGDDLSGGKRYDVGIEFMKISKQDGDKISKCVFSHK